VSGSVNELPQSRNPIRFGIFELDMETGELLKQGSKVRLQEQPFQILRILLEHRGKVVTREDLQHRIWPADTFVDFDRGLYNAIKKLREALGDDAEKPRFIETLSKRGYRFIASVQSGAPPAPAEALTLPLTSTQGDAPKIRRKRFASGWLWGTSAAVAVILVLALNPGGVRDRLLGKNVTPRIQSLAVLPLANLSGDPAQEYFSEGMTDALITDLAQIGSLKVISRTSSMQYKQTKKSLPEIARELNVDGIVEGTVQRSGDRVRITAQLIKSADGFHLWSETYDRELKDVFAVQDEIARSVAGSLKVTLLGAATAAPSAQAKNADAYTAYLQGRYFLRRPKENLEKAVGYYEHAIKLDPGYALAWADLARARSLQADSGYVPLEEGYRRAREAAERALALDPNLAEAHAAMGTIKMAYDWDWAGADASFQRALALQPGNATVLRAASDLAANLGRLEEALTLDRRAVELDPLNTSSHYYRGLHAYYAGRLEEAITAFKKALELTPDRPLVHELLGVVHLAQAHPQEAVAEMEREPETIWHVHGLALAYHALGRKKESEAALADLIAKRHADAAYQIAEVYAYRGEADRALEWLERAYSQRDGGLPRLKIDPLLKNIEHDPRYAAFLKKMRLPA
jgi:TolB-like protein/DNA-binding winged helix-turn-helix (wHTH) protein/Tfp pilus assembly protein PilF